MRLKNGEKMKKIMESWLKFLNEGSIMSSSNLPKKFTGIIQIKPTDISFLQDLQLAIQEKFPNQKPIEKLHVTLLHQSVPKKVTSREGLRGDKALKALFKSPRVLSILPPLLEFGDIGIKSEDGRTSTFIKIKNHTDLRKFLNTILLEANLDTTEIKQISNVTPQEIDRIFHISLTNLTGNPGDSLANISNGEKINL
tara:strand:- start:6 stop:596 length:591 start_codon:yes stop_codon:yes gene_type:complete